MKTSLMPLFGWTILTLSGWTMLPQFQATASAQDSLSTESVAAANLAAAKELSSASGRPIFAIAGRST